MENYALPYGRGTLDCGELRKLNPMLLSSRLNRYEPAMGEEQLVSRAMAHPIQSPCLKELAIGKKKVVLIASDHTRPVPSKLIVPKMLAEIREGNREAQITILVATGCHRGTTKDELLQKFGREIMEQETIVVHDCDCSRMADLGTLPSGGRLLINQLAVEADLLVAEGFIEPHFFAGFSGGRKSVLPGVAQRNTVLYNHNGHFIDSPNARTGVMEHNPIHQDMIFAARKVGLDFICNVVLNEAKQVIYAVAGDCEKAHEDGCRFLNQYCRVTARPADLVVTSNGGYPLDQNIYQAVKGMTAAEAIVKQNGVIIMIAKCEDGHGGEGFYNCFHEERDLGCMLQRFIGTLPEETRVDQWQAQIFARVLRRASVIFISDMPDAMVENFHLIPAHSMEEALMKARKIMRKERWDTAVIPDGVSVIASAINDEGC